MVLTGIAKNDGDERKVYLRAARVGAVYYLDLGGEDWRAVEISVAGWRVEDRPPVHFWRASTTRPLPVPVPGGDLSLLWQYANIPEEVRPLVTAQDLTDRVIHIELPEIEAYRSETEIDQAFAQDASSILGGLLELFVLTLRQLPSVTLDRPPRMADFTALGEAMLRAEGQPPGTFLGLYQGNRRHSIARSLDASPVASAVRTLAETEKTPLVFEGTMGKLLDRLSQYRDGTEAWPKSARGLGDALRRQRPALAQIGISVEIGKPGWAGVPVTIRQRELRERSERRSEARIPETRLRMVEGEL